MERVISPDDVRWTVEDLWTLPDDGNLYEVIDGELYMAPPPIPAHQLLSGNFSYYLDRFIRRHKLGKLLAAPCAVILPTRRRGVQPDLFFIRRENLSIIGKKAVRGVPDLVIAISSPGTARYDRTTKLWVYAEHGVPEYWIVDVPREMIYQHTRPKAGAYKHTRIYRPGDRMRSDLFPGLVLKVTDLFE